MIQILNDIKKEVLKAAQKGFPCCEYIFKDQETMDFCVKSLKDSGYEITPMSGPMTVEIRWRKGKKIIKVL